MRKSWWFLMTIAVLVALPAVDAHALVVGDTVWSDDNGDGLQDPGELGIPGVVVNLLDEFFNPLDTMATGDSSVPQWAECQFLNTGLDEMGLYCFPANFDGIVRLEIDPSNFLPGGALEGMTSTTGGEVQSVNLGDEDVFDLDFGYQIDDDPPPSNPGTGTPGYWKNHPEAWPVNAIEVGGLIYPKADAIDLMSAPGRGDKTLVLFNHLVSALLNVLIGNESSCIDSTLADADAWMASHPPGSNVRGNDAAWRDEGELLKNILDDYNNGLLCAPSRD